MKLTELFSRTHNKKNNQDNLSLKKKKLKEIGMTSDDLLDMELDTIEKRILKHG